VQNNAILNKIVVFNADLATLQCTNAVLKKHFLSIIITILTILTIKRKVDEKALANQFYAQFYKNRVQLL
jgi:hypothetical protein